MHNHRVIISELRSYPYVLHNIQSLVTQSHLNKYPCISVMIKNEIERNVNINFVNRMTTQLCSQ